MQENDNTQVLDEVSAEASRVEGVAEEASTEASSIESAPEEALAVDETAAETFSETSADNETAAESPAETQSVAADAKKTSKRKGRRADKDHLKFSRIARRSLPELFLFNAFISACVAIVLEILSTAASYLLASKGMALTTANALDVMLSWQGALLILIAIVVITLYVTLDLFAHIIFCNDLLEGASGRFLPRAASAIKKAFLALPRFFTPTGIPTIIYIVLAAPLIGVGFSIGLTRDLYIPSFIMNVVWHTPLYAVGYVALLIVLVVIGILHFFTIPAVLIDGTKPTTARKQSKRIVLANTKRLLRCALKVILNVAVIVVVLAILGSVIYYVLYVIGASFPKGYHTGALELMEQNLEPTDEALALSLYRVVCFFFATAAFFIKDVVILLIGSSLVLYSVHLYRWFRNGKDAEEPRYEIPKRRRHRISTFFGIVLFILVAFFMSVFGGFALNYLEMMEKPVQIVAHRLGGDTAPENSIPGLEVAVEEGVFGAETDIQRTKDGYYVINHDDSFKRLAGVDAAPQDLTLEEAKQLVLVDSLYPDEPTGVLTIEELIDESKGRIKLFIELKGKTADRQMVDDIVRIVREKDAVDDVVLISLYYDCIAYAEETYPEFKTGLLFFAQQGDPSLLKCDILLAEEETATTFFIMSGHDAGKEVGVWTANDYDTLRKVLLGDADYVITDRILSAEAIQDALDDRTEIEIIADQVLGFHL